MRITQIKNIRTMSNDELETEVNTFLKEIKNNYIKIQQDLPHEDGRPHLATIYYFIDVED